MGAWLRKKKLAPQMVLCSTARRVKETCELVLAELGAKPILRETRHLYMALPREILAVIGKSPDDINTLMVIGHNPGMGSLAHWLAGQGNRQDLAGLAEKFPTAAVAVLDFDVEHWAELDADAGTLRHFATPKGED
jgi:phosphohistidine phosphatase